MVKCSDFTSRSPTEDNKYTGRPGAVILKTDCKELLYSSMQDPLETDDHSKAAPGTCLLLSLEDPGQGAPGRTPMLGFHAEVIVQILCSLVAPRSLVCLCGGI